MNPSGDVPEIQPPAGEEDVDRFLRDVENHPDLPAWKAMGRAWERFQNNPFNRLGGAEFGRFVPPDYVYYVVDGRPAQTYARLKQLPAIKSWQRISTDVPKGQAAMVLEEGKR